MPALEALLGQVFLLFSLLIVGFAARRLKVFGEESVRGMTSLILKVTLPAMILDSMARQSFTPQILNQSLLILLISFAVYAVLIVLSVPLGTWLRAPGTDRGVYRFVLVFSNVGFMGFPIVQAAFGSDALFYLAIYNLPFNLLTFTIGVLMLVKGHEGHGFKLHWSQLVSPVVISIVVGFVVFLAQLKLPAIALEAFKLCGSITTPLSMIAIGGMLAQSPIREIFGEPRLYLVSVLRLIAWPLLVFVALVWWVPNPLLAGIPALITAMPAAANTALLATEYEANNRLASKAVFISTLFSIVTIPLIMALISSS